jgi:DNA-binding cell septation regulator SpoVG
VPDGIAVAEVKLRLCRGKGGARVGWASCVINGGILINSIEIMRGAAGKLYLVCPTQQSRSGASHPYFCPVNREARAALEEAILGKLSARGAHTNDGGQL